MYLVTMKGGFLGFRNRLVNEYPDARHFKTLDEAKACANTAAQKYYLSLADWEVMSVRAYDSGACTCVVCQGNT